MSLTKRQKQILEYLDDFLGRKGYSPTLEEIAAHFQLASLNGVYKHLKALEERGFIRRKANRARSIQVLDPEKESSSPTLPLMGYVRAGHPVEALVNQQQISVPESFLTGGSCYVLRVQGDSMVEEHIQDGDYVVVEQRNEARSGEIVVALIDGINTTLKRYFREGTSVRLQPANPRHAPLLLTEERFRIQGVVVGLMRKY